MLGRAQRVLSAEVLTRLQERPNERLPPDLWKRLSSAEKAMVLEVRKNQRDGYAAPPAEQQPPRQRQEQQLGRGAGPQQPYAGRDPIQAAANTTAAQIVARAGLAQPRPDPITGLDPQSMHEVFGGVVDTTGLEHFEGKSLMHELKSRFFAHHTTLSYDQARELMFTKIDNRDGVVMSVYTDAKLNAVDGIPKANGPTGFNTEHTWPQSQLKKAGKKKAVSDLHHLFPTDSESNNKRGSYPFGTVVTVMWEEPPRQPVNGVVPEGSKLGTDSRGQIVFQPRPEHRGDVARAMFWIATAYELPLRNDEEAVLKLWDKADLVDDAELARDAWAKKYQGDDNPYVLKPELIDRIGDL